MSPLTLFLACSTCRTTMLSGGGEAASWSIFSLLAVILAVLCGFLYSMFRLARRAKENFDPSLSDDYIPADSRR